MDLAHKKFCDVNLSDPFFDSLKSDYAEFENWFSRKANDFAYVFTSDDGLVGGFLYLKIESGAVEDVSPVLPPSRRIKIGTFKIIPHGTKLGERFLKKIFDHALAEDVSEIYVTVFEKHLPLLNLFERYGFRRHGTKSSPNGTELVLLKTMGSKGENVLDRYPFIKTEGQAIYLLSLYPSWHTRLLPDSILKNEDASIVKDISHSNSIHKVYLAAMRGMEKIRTGDVILIYRTSDNEGPAHYRSVATSICVIEEYRNVSSFSSLKEFVDYCSPYSVFSGTELKDFWNNKKYPHVIRFTYNFALPKRVTRGKMIEELGFDQNDYWGFMKIDESKLKLVINAGRLHESIVVN